MPIFEGEQVVTLANLATVFQENQRLRTMRARPIQGTVVEVAPDGQSGYVVFDDDPEVRVFFSAAELEPSEGADDGWGT